jgi:2-dehydro-3-deoxyphosphogluconate aldolase/(4S)-4-hydroxy-2-oxoglutarate aldolase
LSLEFIKREKIIAVLRGVKKEEMDNIVGSLRQGGIHLLEITLENPDALEIIKYIKEKYGDSVMVGAGTVLDPESARSAILSGAQFIFSPTVNTETIKMTKRNGAVSIPGALTPTEILTAYENGADAVKVFPISALNDSYLNDIHGPLPYIPIIPTGGVDLDNVEVYLEKKNVIAVGVGSSLVNRRKINDKHFFEQLSESAKKFREKADK